MIRTKANVWARTALAAGLALSWSTSSQAYCEAVGTCMSVAQGTINPYTMQLINQMQNTLASVMNTVGSGIQGSISGEMEHDTVLTDTLAARIDASDRRLATALGSMMGGQENFGVSKAYTAKNGKEHRTTSIPFSACEQRDAGGSVRGSRRAATQARAMDSVAAEEHNTKPISTTEAVSRMQRLPDEAFETDKYVVARDDAGTEPMSVNGKQVRYSNSLTPEEYKNGFDAVMTITNPMPLPTIDQVAGGKMSATPLGKEYKTRWRERDAAMRIPQSVLLDGLSKRRTPTSPTTADRQNAKSAEKVWKKLSPGYQPLSSNGLISEWEWLNTRANMPYYDISWVDNYDSWTAELADMQPKALQIESLKLQAVQNRMQYRTMVAIEQMSTMMAVESAKKITKEVDPAVRDLLVRVTAQVARDAGGAAAP